MNCRIIAGAFALCVAGPALAQTPPPGAETVEVAPPSPRPQPPPSAAPGLETPEQRGWALSLGAREDLRVRASDQTTDGSPAEQDQYLIVGLDGSARSPGGSASAVLDLSLWLDFSPDRSTPTALASARSTRDPWVQLFDAYGQYEGDGAVQLVRVGHQVAEHGVPVPFDGAYAVVRPGGPRLELFAFGGQAAYAYAVDTKMFEDWLGSAGLVARPLDDLRLELDYRLESQVVSQDGVAPRSRQSDSVYGASATYRLGEASRVKLLARGVDAKLATAALSASLVSLPAELGLDVRVAVQPSELEAFSESANPYFLTLGPSLAHWRARADAWKALSFDLVRLEAHVGYEARQLLEDSPRPFNNNTARVYGVASVDRIAGLPGLVLTLTGDRIGTEATLQGRGEWALGGSLGWAGARLRAEVGTAFAAYRYDYYRTVEERSEVRTYYADVRGRVFNWLAVRARYSLEVFDRRLQTFSIGLSESF